MNHLIPPDTPPKRAALHTLGCRLNQTETVLLTEKLAEAGYTIVPFGEAADLGVIHTCTVTREADAKSRKLIRQFIRVNPDAFTVVIGCYAQMASETLAAIEGVDVILGNQEKLNLLDYVGPAKNATPLIVRDRIQRDDFRIDFAPSQERYTRRANLKIQDGCNAMCSFCIIPFARGRVRSRELDNLLDEAKHLVARGAREIVLTGINLGTYAHADCSIYDVVARLGEIPGLARLRIGSIEPTTIPEGLFDFMNDPAHPLLPFLHIPLQSGSNRILLAMRRNYTREAYLDFLRLAAERVPLIGLGADIMVGFPGETDADFEDSCAVLRDSALFYAHIFKYSERKGAASARLPDKVDPRIMNRRSAALHALSAEKTRRFAESQLGKTFDVLFEECEDGHWTGYTGNYLRVALRSENALTNELRSVRLVRAGHEIVYGALME
jgi:threonylcarbamoyladenosine tRNA methylthiotransferase MtaB